MVLTEKSKKAKNTNWELFRLAGIKAAMSAIATVDERYDYVTVISIVNGMIKRRKK